MFPPSAIEALDAGADYSVGQIVFMVFCLGFLFVGMPLLLVLLLFCFVRRARGIGLVCGRCQRVLLTAFALPNAVAKATGRCGRCGWRLFPDERPRRFELDATSLSEEVRAALARRTRVTAMPSLFYFLFRSIPAEFLSDYPLEESVERLRAVMVPSIFHTLFKKEAAVGKVRRGRVSIRRQTPVGSSFKPSFIGSFHEKSGQVVLAGAFTMPFFNRAILTFGLPFIGLAAVLIAIVAAVNGDVPNPERTVLAFAVLAFWLGVECLGRRFSRDDVAWLSTAIRLALSKNTDHLQEPL